MKGLIIANDRTNAENVKLIVEHMKGGFEVDILDPEDSAFCLIDSSKYDFIINSVKPAMAHEIISQLRTFAKTILDKNTSYVGLYRNQKIIYVDRNKIIGIEVLERCCIIHTIKFTYSITRITLNKLLELLDDPDIVRCHKSFAVNIRYVHAFYRETPNRWVADFIIDTDFDCRISERFIKNVTERFNVYHEVKVNKNVEFC